MLGRPSARKLRVLDIPTDRTRARNLRDNRFLDKSGFAPFAQVVEGMDVVQKLYYSYGELAPKGTGPDATKTETEGNRYLEERFPRLDYILTARVVD